MFERPLDLPDVEDLPDYFPPADYEAYEYESSDDSIGFGDLPDADALDSIHEPSDDPPDGFIVPAMVGVEVPLAAMIMSESELPAWLTAMAVDEADPALIADTLPFSPDDVSASKLWNFDLPVDSSSPAIAMTADDWLFLRSAYDADPAELHSGVLQAEVIGQSIEAEGEVNHVISLVETYDDHARQLMLAEFQDVELATAFYLGLQDAAQGIPAGQLAGFAEMASSSHAEWQSVSLEQANELIEAKRALDQDVTPPADLDLSAVIETAPTIRYETRMTPHIQAGETTYQVLMAQFTADGRSSGSETASYAPIGNYKTELEAKAVDTGLTEVRQEVADIVGEGDLRVQQALVATAHAIAAGNGLIAAEEHLFPAGSDPRFDDLITPNELVQQIEADLARDEVVIAEIEQVGQPLSHDLDMDI